MPRAPNFGEQDFSGKVCDRRTRGQGPGVSFTMQVNLPQKIYLSLELKQGDIPIFPNSCFLGPRPFGMLPNAIKIYMTSKL